MWSPDYQKDVLAVSAFHMLSREKTSDPYKVWLSRFGVWGWGTTKEMWPLFKAGWSTTNGWGASIQRLRIKTGMYVVTPQLSRVKNIGMLGINFKVTDATEIAKWENVYISDKPINYQNVKPDLLGYINSTHIF